MQTAKKLGLVKGDFIITSMRWAGIIISDAHTATPCCEVWGLEHEMGSCYAEELYKCNFETFEKLAKDFGYDGSAYAEVSKKAIAKARQEQFELPLK